MTNASTKRWLKYPIIFLGIFWLVIFLVYKPSCGGGKEGCATDLIITLGSFPTLILALKFDIVSGATNMGQLKLIDSLVASVNIFLFGLILGKIIDKFKK